MEYTEEALHFRLRALRCPFEPLPSSKSKFKRPSLISLLHGEPNGLCSVNVFSPSTFRFYSSLLSLAGIHHLHTLVVWLEDTHIRRLEVSQRTVLHDYQFSAALLGYLKLLPAPKRLLEVLAQCSGYRPDVRSLQPSVAWLVDFALNLHYADSAALYNTPVDPWQGRCLPVIAGINKSPEVEQELRAISDILQRGNHFISDGSSEIATVVADIVQSIVLDVTKPKIGRTKQIRENVSATVGFTTKDPVVDRAVSIMRALNVRQLRILQNEINELLADLQSLTATVVPQ